MTLLQKWIAGLLGLGAGVLVFTNPNGVWTAAMSIRSVTAGSIVDVTTGGKGRTQY